MGCDIDLLELCGELRAFATEFLGFLGFLPDGRIFEFATDFFESLFLQIVFKETPLRS